MECNSIKWRKKQDKLNADNATVHQGKERSTLKRLSILLAAVFVISMFAGCGSTSSADSVSEAANVSEIATEHITEEETKSNIESTSAVEIQTADAEEPIVVTAAA